MTAIVIKYTLGSEVFLKKSVEYSFHFNKDNTNIKSESFSDHLILGNFTNALLWKSLLAAPNHFHGFEILRPLSRIKVSLDLLHEIQRNFVKKFDVDESKNFGNRKMEYQSIYKYLSNVDSIDISDLTKSLKLSPFSIQQADVHDELLMNSDDLNVLSTSYQSMWEGQMEYFNSAPLRFLPKQLVETGLDSLNGFIYENSGYNSHLIYLPQLQASFIFSGDLTFSEVWFLFVQTLHEIGFLGKTDYLETLMKGLCPYPWVNVEVTSGD